MFAPNLKTGVKESVYCNIHNALCSYSHVLCCICNVGLLETEKPWGCGQMKTDEPSSLFNLADFLFRKHCMQ